MGSRESFPVACVDLVVEELLDGELLLYDPERHVACSLNRTAALVWRGSNGERSVSDLAGLLRERLGEPCDDDLVLVALDELADQGLIASGYAQRNEEATGISRRRFLRRAGLVGAAVGAAAVALPVVDSITAPSPAQAASLHFPQTTTTHV